MFVIDVEAFCSCNMCPGSLVVTTLDLAAQIQVGDIYSIRHGFLNTF